MHFPLCHLPLHLVLFYVCGALTNSSNSFVKPDLAHLTAEPTATVFLNAKGELRGSEWSVNLCIPPLPATRELRVAAIFGVNQYVLTLVILSEEVPLLRITLGLVICGLDAVGFDPNRSRIDFDVDFKSFTITFEVAFAIFELQLWSMLSVIEQEASCFATVDIFVS